MSQPVIERLFTPTQEALIVLLVIPLMVAIINLGMSILKERFREIAGGDEKPKNKFDRFSVPYDQDTDDDKPKRQTYMTIGDDGELVEIEK